MNFPCEADRYHGDEHLLPRAPEPDPDLIADQRRQDAIDAARRGQQLAADVWNLGVALNRAAAASLRTEPELLDIELTPSEGEI